MNMVYQDQWNELHDIDGRNYELRHDNGPMHWKHVITRAADVYVERCNGKPNTIFLAVERVHLGMMPLPNASGLEQILKLFTGRSNI